MCALPADFQTETNMGRVYNLKGKEIGSAVGAAAGTAAAGPVGTAIGAALGGIVAGIFGGGSSTWTNAGPGVHDWFTKYGEQAFLDYMRANGGDFGSLDKVKAQRQVWAMRNDGGAINLQTAAHYVPSGGWDPVFRAIGIDLPASIAKNVAAGGGPTSIGPQNVVMLPGAGTPAAPVPAVDYLSNANDKANAGVPLTGPEAAALKKLAVPDLSTVLVLVAGVVIIWILLRKG